MDAEDMRWFRAGYAAAALALNHEAGCGCIVCRAVIHNDEEAMGEVLDAFEGGLLDTEIGSWGL